MRNKPAITIPDDARKQAITSIRRYVVEHMSEEIGDLKATPFPAVTRAVGQDPGLSPVPEENVRC